MYARACVMGSYSESEKASQHREMPRNAVAAPLLSGRNRQRRFPGTTLMMHGVSGSGLGAAPWSKFALQRQPSVRQAALEQLPTGKGQKENGARRRSDPLQARPVGQ